MWDQFRKCLYLVDRSTVWQAGLVVGLIIVGTMIEALGIGLIFPFVKMLVDPSELQRMTWVGYLFGPVSTGTEREVLIFMAIILLVVFVVKNAFLSAVYFVQLRFVAMNEAFLARDLFACYLNGAYALHLTRNTSQYIRNITGTVGTVFGGVFMGFITLGSEFFLLFLLTMVLVVVEPFVTLGVSLILAISVGIYYGLVKHRLVIWGAVDQDLKKQILQLLQQGLHSIKEIKILGREPFVIKSLAENRNRLARNQTIKNLMTAHVPRLWMETIMVTGVLLVVILILVYEGTSGKIFAALTLFAAAAFRLIPSMNRILGSLTTIKNGTAAVNAIHEDLRIFAANTDDSDGAGPESLSLSQAIHVVDVSFTYPNSDTSVLTDVDLVINVGDSVGLVGASGAGKTTFADVLLGLLIPTSGRVTVDGVDIATAKRQWRSLIGYVPQSIYLLDDTIRRNIAFGLDDDEIDEQGVRNAVRLASLEALVDDLPQGLDTYIGEHGVRLSGGQAQRVGIARALYRDPKVLVLDEATSSLDNETEREISNAIDHLSGQKTLIIIAHRLSTVRKCDRLAFMREGRISDIGTFEELNQRNPEFRRMVKLSQL